MPLCNKRNKLPLFINMSYRYLAYTVALAISAQHSLFAASFDWPQWQGPDRNAVSKERGLLQEWPKDGPPLAWKVKGIGSGYGGPSIAAGRIYGMSNRGDDEFVWSLSETDGKELWATRLGPALTEGMPQGKEGAGCTPTVDGERLYVLGLSGDLVCLQAKDGKIIWRRSLTNDFGGRLPTWRYNESPLVDGDKVVCTPGGKEATMVALNKLTGETIWKTEVPELPAAIPSVQAGDAVAGVPASGIRERHILRPSRSISRGSANTCSSPRRHWLESRRPTGNCSGGMTGPPTGPASTVLRRSTTMAGCSPPRPMVPAVGW